MIFVTGSTGLAGSELVPILLERKAPVRIAISKHIVELVEPPQESVRVDFQDESSWEAAMQGCTALFLLTPFGPHQDELEMRIARAAQRAGVRRVVKQSVPGVGLLPDNRLAKQHERVTDYLHKLGFPEISVLCPHPFMQDFAFHCGITIRHEGRFYKPSGEGVVSYVDARDVAAVVAECLVGLGHANQTYFLTGPEALTNEEVAEIISHTLVLDVEYEDIRHEDAREFLRAKGVALKDIEALFDLHPFACLPMAGRVLDTVREILGRPPVSFAQFVVDYRWAFEPTREVPSAELPSPPPLPPS